MGQTSNVQTNQRPKAGRWCVEGEVAQESCRLGRHRLHAQWFHNHRLPAERR